MPIAYIDLDNTLCDYIGQLHTDLERLQGPTEIWLDDVRGAEKKFPWFKARMDIIKAQPGWWLSLEPLADGFVIFQMLYDMGFEVVVATKTSALADNAATEKILWCKKHLPGVEVAIVTHNKGLLQGEVLVDDWPPYCSQWLEANPRGRVILPDCPWNEDFTHERVMRFESQDSLRACEDFVEHLSSSTA